MGEKAGLSWHGEAAPQSAACGAGAPDQCVELEVTPEMIELGLLFLLAALLAKPLRMGERGLRRRACRNA